MKKTVKTVAMLATLALTAAGCQKEVITDRQDIVADMAVMRTVNYTVDGTAHQLTLNGDNAWYEFLHMAFALAEEGHSVSFVDTGKTSSLSAKETVTYTTSSLESAMDWCDKMADAGYTITLQYDRVKGIYTCTATK